MIQQAIDRNILVGKIDGVLKFVLDRDKDWKPDWNNREQEKFYLKYIHSAGKYFITADRVMQALGVIYMSEGTAKELYEILNKGKWWNILIL